MKRIVLVAMVACGSAQALPTFDEVRAAHRPSDVALLDRHGEPIQTLRVDKAVRRLPWVPLADISPALQQAIVLSEDKRFFEHSGVDWGAAARSAFGNLWNTRTRGASTLTMQLAGLIDDGLARPVGGRSVAQKFGQVVTAKQLEARWRKSQILEAYLNAVPLRGEIVGIGALAQTMFDPLLAPTKVSLKTDAHSKCPSQGVCGFLTNAIYAVGRGVSSAFYDSRGSNRAGSRARLGGGFAIASVHCARQRPAVLGLDAFGCDLH